MSGATATATATAAVATPPTARASAFRFDDRTDALPSLTRGERAALAAELAFWFFLSPVLILAGFIPGRWKMLVLLLGALWALAVVCRRRARSAEVGLGAAAAARFGLCVRAGLAAFAALPLVVGAVQVASGRPVFPLVAQQPGLFLALTIAYPLSALAQEFIFRSFYFWRYAALLPRGALVWVNVASFAWVHVVYGSWVSVALSAVGGVLFTSIYLRYRSLWGVFAVHTIVGLTVFAMGFGRYFYSGTMQLAADSQRIASVAPAPR